jgi:hypothetical protein
MFNRFLNKFILILVLLLGLSINTAYAQLSTTYGALNIPFSARALTGSAINSSTYTLPVNTEAVITWVVAYGSSPASITLLLQGSLDNSVWNTLDTVTSTTATSSTITSGGYRFFRFRVNASSGGTTVSIGFSAKQAGGGSGGTGGSGDASESEQQAQTALLQDILDALEAGAAEDVANDNPDGSTKPVKIGCRANTTTPSAVANDDRVNLWCNANGAAAIFNTAHTVGGCTPGSVISSGAVLETEIKASAGQLYTLSVTSLDATPVYIRVYDDTSAGLDESSDTPKLRYGIPAAAASDLSGREIPIPSVGINFATGIIFRVTTGFADNNTGALTANEVMVSYCYK